MEQPNYTQHVLLQLNQQRSKGYLCDVIIVVENALFRAHKNVLAACSSYFKYLVLHENLITLNKEMVKPSVFSQVLDFIYTGQLPFSYHVSNQGVSDLLRAASYLQLSDLAALCHQKLKPRESNIWPSCNSSSLGVSGHLQVGQSFHFKSLEVRNSHKEELQQEDLSEEEVFTSAADEVNQSVQTGQQTTKSRTCSTSSSPHQSSPPSSSNSSDDLPPNSTSADCNPTLEQWYPTTGWKAAAPKRNRYGREDCLEGSVRTKGQEVERGEPVQEERRASSELEDQAEVRGEDVAVKSELQKSEESGNEDEEWKGNKHTGFIFHRTKPPLHPSLHDSPYLCIPCGKGFPSSEQLITHVDSHKAEEARYANNTDPEKSGNLPLKSSIEEPNLDVALSRYACSVCGKIYVDAVLLNQHERSHRLTRPFSCDVCGKLFTQRGTMTRHMRSHLGLKPFACEECGMSFTRQYRKMEHMRIHEREKRCECRLCEVKFTHQRRAVSHLKMHTMVP